MPLQFTTLTDLQTDLASKPGIYATASNSLVKPLNGFEIHDQTIIREFVDKDGTSRYEVAIQQLLKDTSDNSWGYGSNRQWGDFDKSVTTFQDEVQAHADGFEGTTVGSNTIIKVTLSEVNESRKAARATAFMSDGSTISALLYKDDQGAWQTKVLS